ncbi:SseB family protein [Nocardioides insulae]|uniref:SseB family protein n=1 Tax=Nocardioides insulae TaxID=394734 RepID=UPI0004254456|nr:SseB family protein [Nocardioides insulae]
MTRPDAKRLLGPGFPGDAGERDPRLGEALAAHGRGEASYAAVLAAFAGTRVMVPVVAILGEVETDAQGLAHDKSSDMAAVLITSNSGRRGLLAFTDTAAMQAWDPEARPVPVTVEHAALAAIQEGAAALVVDLAGPVRFVVEGADLEALARGWRLVFVDGAPAWVADPADAERD